MTILTGTAGADWIDGSASADHIIGLEGDDMLNGLEGDDLLEGGEGSDVLDGGVGADEMRGGLGSDVYYVDDAGDLVIEDSNGGEWDWVIVSLDSYTLPANVEDADVWWDSGSTIYGNALNNALMGWWGNDWLEGGAGNDFLHGGSGSDVLVGGTGNDRYHLNSESEGDVDTIVELAGGGIDTVELWWWTHHVLADEVENVEIHGTDAITLIANSSDNVIQLSAGAMTIDGGSGNDTITFAMGHDWVQVDLLTNDNGGGAADDSFTSIENVTGTWGDDVLRGTDGANILIGGFGADTLEGRGGDDELNGGAGVDVMTGGAGADCFRFFDGESGTGTAADRIEDFSSGQDVIDLAAIDADLGTEGDQAFTFIGGAAFSGAAGQLRFASDGNDTRLQADTDGDGFSDFEIVLTGPVVPLIGDFVL
jgi:Ca2+-binding RTX toxin-like protein